MEPQNYNQSRTAVAAAGLGAHRVASRDAYADVVIPDASGAWRATRGVLLAVGPLLCIAALSAQLATFGVYSATIGAAIILAAWSPLAPFGVHALLCVDERAEILPWAPVAVREALAWPTMLLSGRARVETWASSLGVVAGALYWAATIGW